MLAVDTNVLVRLIVRDDADQVRSAERFVGKGAWVSHLVLAETLCTRFRLQSVARSTRGDGRDATESC